MGGVWCVCVVYVCCVYVCCALYVGPGQAGQPGEVGPGQQSTHLLPAGVSRVRAHVRVAVCMCFPGTRAGLRVLRPLVSSLRHSRGQQTACSSSVRVPGCVAQVSALNELRFLRAVWLVGNPLSRIRKYRAHIFSIFRDNLNNPDGFFLDDILATPPERLKALGVNQDIFLLQVCVRAYTSERDSLERTRVCSPLV